IPIVGAFLGCAVAMFLILTVNPIQVIWFFILFNVLQQFEGNVIYPRVVGSSVGLPAMWVLVAVTLGGSMLGIVGMLIYIPLFSVIYSLLREHINKKLRAEKVPPDKWKLKDE
ncbi:MAG TPA: AI-2E family transporter, partial [Lachnospiraceae bacterium]|nr:AI-2E family transporter [Lachnospiraceae bacterium]